MINICLWPVSWPLLTSLMLLSLLQSSLQQTASLNLLSQHTLPHPTPPTPTPPFFFFLKHSILGTAGPFSFVLGELTTLSSTLYTCHYGFHHVCRPLQLR